MARTFISQPTQIFGTETYRDDLTVGSSMTGSQDLETDLNNIRTQIRQILWAGVSGSWYDAVTAPSGTNSARGLNTINTDLSDLEQKRFLFRRQNLNLVNVMTGAAFTILSVAQGTAPANYAAVSGNASGSVVYTLSTGSFGAYNTGSVSGSTPITPKNLVLVRNAWTGLSITGSTGRDIYGLLQAEFGVANGDAFDDLTKRAQISFVEEIVTNGTSSLTQASTAHIGGKTITYSYVRRTALDEIPEDAYLSDSIFFDFPDPVVTNVSVTLQEAINNEVGSTDVDKNITLDLGAGFAWTYTSGTRELWRLASADTEDTLTINVDRYAVSGTYPSTFQQGISVSTSSTEIRIGVNAGTIQTLTGSHLILSGGGQLKLGDNWADMSSYGGPVPLSTGSADWNNYFSLFGPGKSLLGAINNLSQSLSSSSRRTRYNAGVVANLSADVNVTYPTNLDAQLGDYSGKNFITEVNVYLNGVLLIPGQSSANANDVYPGLTSSLGQLKFPYKLRSGSQIVMEIF